MAVQKVKEQFCTVMDLSTKAIGKMEMLMDLEFWLLVICQGMREIGLRASIMDREFILIRMGLSMMEIGIMESIMELEYLTGQMEVFIVVNGVIVEKVVKVSSLELVEQYMKEIGFKVVIMAKVD